jgi:hypothetical protein
MSRIRRRLARLIYNVEQPRHRRPVRPAPNPDVIPLDSLNVARLLFLERLCLMTRDVPGDIAECGVGRGRSMLMLAHIVHIHQIRKFLWGFDSFQGFPEPSSEDASFRNVKEGEAAYDKQHVEKVLRNHLNDELFFRSKISLIKGYFEDTLRLHQGPVSLLNLDVDLYRSYKICLESFYPRMPAGAIITFDEYHREGDRWPGAPKAIDEFLHDKRVTFNKDPLYGKFFVVKNEDAVA